MIEVSLPTLHADQVEAWRQRARFSAIRCGRRWGKTWYGETVACDAAAKGRSVGWFAPEYKFLAESFNDVADILAPIKRGSSKVDGVFRTISGGRVDFWSLENERAGRSRKYHLVVVDEGAFVKPNMLDIWNKSIKPTLLDYRGSAIVLSTPNGVDPENFFWRICNEAEHGFVEYHAPTHKNPLLPLDELAKLESENHPLVFRQEYQAEFVDWSGVQFFALADLLAEGKGAPYPAVCDGVFATIDSATKTGRDNDGTGVVYWALSRHYGTPLIALDYDIRQIEGSLLESWLPTVFRRLEELALVCKARMGSLGVHIEDKASGQILIQQAQRRNWQAFPIDSKLTAVGKSERAISVSGYVHRGMVKFSAPAYDKVVSYKSTTRNHLLAQVLGFRIGVKDQIDDDLLDCFTYGVAIALGNQQGF